MNELLWFILVLCIDVGHVYTTIYRTYFDKDTLLKNRNLFYIAPILLYVVGVILHSIDYILFWRCMAYLAVFHFIRQQYGFMRIYSRTETDKLSKSIDAVAIYSSTIYPIIYWHINGSQKFNWFIEGDFFYTISPHLNILFQVIYVLVLIIYLFKETVYYRKNKSLNLQKNFILLGTALSWYLGIVYFKGDLTFTFLNVVSHGIPYYALVWSFGRKKQVSGQKISTFFKWIFKPQFLFVYVGIVLILSYSEEFLWDTIIWKERNSIFPTVSLRESVLNKSTLSFVIPALALPQLLHYFIDGFIWKINKDKFNWNWILFQK